MLIDCDSCLARDIACNDCVVTVLFSEGLFEEGPIDLDQDEAEALSALADAGLVPQLRLIPLPERSGGSQRSRTGSPAPATVEPWKDSAAG
jgi:hypothetical protein